LQPTQLGREYAQAFNRLEGRAPFIETEEREDLFAALELIVAEATTEKNLAAARSSAAPWAMYPQKPSTTRLQR
jgi:hypothetical protein